MTAYVFVGPTLSKADLENYSDLNFLPPVAQGDLYGIACERPHAIGIIDGYFEGVPSVWHKEILWAITQGIYVFGSASMGALRAAELHVFGMKGVGEIFQAYVDGDLEDDDEVALIHGPEETGFIGLSEPMVNIRATLQRAKKQKIIDDGCYRLLIDIAKETFYPQRIWESITAKAIQRGGSPSSLESFTQWLPRGRVDLKRKDALAMLSKISQTLQDKIPVAEPSFQFEWTQVWDSVVEGKNNKPETTNDIETGLIIDELRLRNDLYRSVKEQALVRYLIFNDSNHEEIQFDKQHLSDKLREFRMRHGLMTREQLNLYLESNGLTEETLKRLIAQETQLQHLANSLNLDNELLDVLKFMGCYEELAVRARNKQDLLAKSGYQNVELPEMGLTPPQLLQWYFQTILGRDIPDDLDAFIREIGLSERTEFYRLLVREYVYLNNENLIANGGLIEKASNHEGT